MTRISPASHTANPTIVDTDIGDDVDDAFALALAAVLPQLRLCGVTTVAGPVEERARLARLVLDAAGMPDVPCVPGSSAMSDGQPGPAKLSHRPLLAGAPPLSPASPDAARFICDCALRFSPLTIIAIGPLTNIAAALRHDPALARRARLVAMGGKLGLPYPDWNIRCDPQAARAVLASGMPVTLVGMHVTMRCKLRPEQLRRLFAAPRPAAVLLARCVLAWRTWQRRMPILHDPLTVAVAADPSLVSLAARRVQITSRGFSFARRNGKSNALVCTNVALERFHALLEAHLLT